MLAVRCCTIDAIRRIAIVKDTIIPMLYDAVLSMLYYIVSYAHCRVLYYTVCYAMLYSYYAISYARCMMLGDATAHIFHSRQERKGPRIKAGETADIFCSSI